MHDSSPQLKVAQTLFLTGESLSQNRHIRELQFTLITTI